MNDVEFQIAVSAIQKKRAASSQAFDNLEKAVTEDEETKAAIEISNSWNQ